MAFFKRNIHDRLNICLITRKTPTVGFLIPVIKGLLQRGHRVCVIAQAETEFVHWLLPDGMTVKTVHTKSLSHEDTQQKIKTVFEGLHGKDPFHVVHSMDSSGLLIGKDKKRLNIAMVYDVDATNLNNLYSIIGLSQDNLRSFLKTGFLLITRFAYRFFRHDRKLLKTADALFVYSENQRMAIERYFLYPDQRIFSIPYGLQIEDLSKREKSRELLTKLKLPEGSQIVMTATDMMEFAELRNLVRAFERVAIKKNNARMVVLGTGPMFKKIEFEVLNYALGRRVIFVGDVPPQQMSDYIVLADVFVNLSSRTSAAEQSLLEAMAQEKVVIASDVSALSSVIENKTDGFLIRPADYDSLAELIFMVFNREIPSQLIGQKAREKVLNLFDSQAMVEKTLSGYQLALRRR